MTKKVLFLAIDRRNTSHLSTFSYSARTLADTYLMRKLAVDRTVQWQMG